MDERDFAALLETALERQVGTPLRALAEAMTPRPAAPAEGGLGPWNYRGHPDQPFGPVSYAQFGEDLILQNLFHMLRIERPGFIDVGAHHPVACNNTALLYARGSRGVNIDANPHFMPAYAELRPEDVTLNLGIGPAAGELDYYMIDEFSGRNGFDRATAEAFVAAHPAFSIREVRRIPVVTLDEVVATQCGGTWPDLLCIDAEGLDCAILESAHFGPAGPRVLCVENVSGDDHDAAGRLEAIAAARGFSLFARTVGNLILWRPTAPGG
ncbi:FkbM family methyltransferase [Rhodovastum atsumiense]|nr:FkbM family methyltransferase [Rhodovastum atsumiense]CAH2603335.1 FkbM family methyltransferase [Rhodovastum atsumiense]